MKHSQLWNKALTAWIFSLVVFLQHLSSIDAFVGIQGHHVVRPRVLRLAEASTEDQESASSFASLGLSPDVLASVPWETPTMVQRIAIPAILQPERLDAPVWCEAPTGSGKTAAYLLPLIHLLKKSRFVEARGIQSLVLCPTRELAVQIGSVLQKLTAHQKLNVVVVHGGVPLGPQLEALTKKSSRRRIDMVVATPGRLGDLLTRSAEQLADTQLEFKARKALESKKDLSLDDLQSLQLEALASGKDSSSLQGLLGDLQFLVLDEADRLLSRAFDSELYAVLDLVRENKDQKQSRHSPSPLSTWLFSATFPKAMEPRVDRMLRYVAGRNADEDDLPQPIRVSCVSIDRRSSDDEEVSNALQKRLDKTKLLTKDNDGSIQQRSVGPASTIDLRTIRLDQPKRTQALRKLLKDHSEWDRVLVFVGTRYSSEHIASKLRRVGISAAELHGKLDQDARARRLSAFAQGRTRVLLTTDIASRGIDIEGLPVVINYDLPRSTEDFVHRVGRTGRAGQRGIAVTFCTSASESHLDLIEKRHLTNPVAREVLPGLEPHEEEWVVQANASRMSAPGVQHSIQGLAHDRMNGGIKGKRKSKKDRLREKAAREVAPNVE